MENKTLAIFAILTITVAMTLVAAITSDQAFAKYRGKHIHISSVQHQESHVSTAGGGSSITNSGNNAATSTITNTGGIS